MNPAETGAPMRRPTAKIDAAAAQAARVMVDVFRLSTDADGASAILSGVLDGLASLVHHDAAGVYVVDARGSRLRHTMVRGCDLPIPKLEAPFAGKGIVGDVLASGQPAAVSSDTSDEASVGRPCARSRLVVPIVGSSGKTLGVLDVWSDQPGGYDKDATDLITLYGSAVASAIENARLHAESARLHAEVVDKQRLDSDLALARQVMEELLPHTTPSISGLDIAGAHETSLAVGGDYYEFIPLVDDRWAVVIADVVGKGVAAAILVSAIRASMSSLVGHELAVRAIMRRANRFFHESVEGGKYVTLFYAVIDPPRRRMLYVNAGHVPPVLLRGNGEVELLEEGGVPLGLFESPRYFEGHIALREGDVLTLYTDGVVETANRDDDFYGMDRLIALVKDRAMSSATEICSSIMQEVRRHGGGARSDDRTLVVMKAAPFASAPEANG